ncbi:MAG: LysR family transcriptional regulator [Firmicutes bacterium]|nr:LysR family transcriptional regulator [Bacillota bacterium]
MIEIYLLEQLVGIAKYKTLSEASEHLHVTQPTLTRSVHKLENILGAKLFDRDKNRIYINDTGKLAVEYAKKILATEQDMVNAVKALERSKHTVSVGSCAPIPNILISEKLKKSFPENQILTEMSDEKSLTDGLKNGTYQIIVLDHPEAHEDMCCKKIFTEQLRISVLPAHPAAMHSSVSFAEINGGTFLTYKDIGIWLDISRKNMPGTRFIFQEGMDEYLEVVNSSSLPTFDTDIASKVFGASPNRRSIPISDAQAKMTYYAFYNAKDKKRFESLIDEISESVNACKL